jgi:cytochrome P450
MTFFLAMIMRPDVQKKAQDEVDFIVGHDRLPEYSDMPHLPYLSAVVKEVLRGVRTRITICLC